MIEWPWQCQGNWLWGFITIDKYGWPKCKPVVSCHGKQQQLEYETVLVMFACMVNDCLLRFIKVRSDRSFTVPMHEGGISNHLLLAKIFNFGKYVRLTVCLCICVFVLRYSPYPEPVYTGWSSVHWNATGMPLDDPVYTGIPLGHPANTCRVHWNTTGKT